MARRAEGLSSRDEAAGSGGIALPEADRQTPAGSTLQVARSCRVSGEAVDQAPHSQGQDAIGVEQAASRLCRGKAVAMYRWPSNPHRRADLWQGAYGWAFGKLQGCLLPRRDSRELQALSTRSVSHPRLIHSCLATEPEDGCVAVRPNQANQRPRVINRANLTTATIARTALFPLSCIRFDVLTSPGQRTRRPEAEGLRGPGRLWADAPPPPGLYLPERCATINTRIDASPIMT